MSIMAELDRLAEENFGEFGFDTLDSMEKEIILTLFMLENTSNNHTDLFNKKSDNIRETKNK